MNGHYPHGQGQAPSTSDGAGDISRKRSRMGADAELAANFLNEISEGSSKRPRAAATAAVQKIKSDERDELADEEDYMDDSAWDVPIEESKGYLPDDGLIVGALMPYIPAQYPALMLHQQIQTGDINVDPDYQREIVWSEARQEALIDSIFHNYFLPPVLFAVRRNPTNGRETRTCIDGKQRLTSIYLFLSGMICWRPSSGPGKGKRYWVKYPENRQAGRADLILPEREHYIFTVKMIQCCEFRDLPESAERDIFARVQMGMALNPAEKLQALANPMAKYINSLVQKWILSEGGFTTYFGDWDQARARPFQNMAMLISFVKNYPTPVRSPSASGITIWIQRDPGPDKRLRHDVDRCMEIYIDILRDHKAAALDVTTKRLAPVEFAFFGVVIHALRKSHSPAEIASRLGDLRIKVRQFDSNVRANSRTLPWMYEWLEKIPKTPRRDLVREDEELLATGDDAEYIPPASALRIEGDRRQTRARY